jgi:hypothetical protein
LNDETEQGITSGKRKFDCNLYIKHSTVAIIFKRNSNMAAKQFATLVFNTICDENSAKLDYTPRLEEQILNFTSKLMSEYQNVRGRGPAAFNEFICLLDERPPWACKVMVWEFTNRKHFSQFAREDEKQERNSKSEDVPLSQLRCQGMCRARLPNDFFSRTWAYLVKFKL